MFVQISETVVVNLEQIEHVDFNGAQIHLINGGVVWCDDEHWDEFFEKLMQYKRK
jgi:uncharacterized protein YlzI (FlbEa/FlbD family)